MNTLPNTVPPLVASLVPVRVLALQDAATQAAAAWARIPDRSDYGLLDQFIASYPCSREAYLAFSLRYQLLQTERSIDEYNRFIPLYRYRTGAEQALYELFDLIRKQDLLSGYLDFFKRYPESPLDRIAELRVHALAFAAAYHLDDTDDYDAFLGAFPGASQVLTVMRLATAKAIAQATAEQSQMQATPPPEGFEQWQQDQANGLRTSFNQEFSRFMGLWGLPPTPPSDDAVLTQILANADRDQKAGPKLVSFHRLHRLKCVAVKVYPDTEATASLTSDLVTWSYLKAVVDKLGDIDTTLKNNQAALVALLKDEFEETRGVLQHGFQQIGDDLKGLGYQIANLETTLQNGLRAVNGSLTTLHGDLQTVQDGILQIHTALGQVDSDLTQINQGIQQTNSKLGMLDASIQGVNDTLNQLNTNVTKGFNNVNSQLGGLQDEVVRGFDRQQKAIEGLQQQSGGDFMGFVQSMQGGFARLRDVGGQATSQVWQQTKKGAGHVADQIAREASDVAANAKQQLSDLGNVLSRVWKTLDGHIVVFDFTTPGQFSLNFMAYTYYGEIEAPFGAKLSTANINPPTSPPDQGLRITIANPG